MKTSYKILLVAGVAIVFVLAAAFALSRFSGDGTPRTGEEPPAISSYEECVAAGYPSIDTYPEQCETPEGERFMRVLGEDELLPGAAAHIESKSDLIVVDEPAPLTAVTSPLTVRGNARGPWYFEATFPVRLLDGNGTVLVEWYASAVLDPDDPDSTWMTEAFVPFETELHFAVPATGDGTLVLAKSNPSGLEEHEDELRIPIRFEGHEEPRRTIELFYYDPDRDTDADGNILCSEDGLVPVVRSIPLSQTPIQDSVRLLLAGELTPQEEAQGITTEYPLEDLELEGASLADGVLTLGFADPRHATSGGSCRAGILWMQIRETALQFDEVDEVRFEPEDLFQP